MSSASASPTSSAREEPSRALEAEVDAGERLRVAVVQLAGDAVALLGDLELAHLLLQLEPLLPEVADEVAGDAEVDRPHDVDVGAAVARERMRQTIEPEVHGRDQSSA